MKILRYPVGQLQANCYFIVENDKCLIFDAGDSADFLLEEIQRLKLKPIGVFASHGHFDHIMAVGDIQLSFDIPFYISKEDTFLVKRVEETAKHFLRYDPGIVYPKNFIDLKEGSLKVEGFSLKVLRTPGHTPGASCFYFEKEGWVLTGDTLFKGAIGRYDHSYSDKHSLMESLERLFALSENTVVYPGHGEETTILAEKIKTPGK